MDLEHKAIERIKTASIMSQSYYKQPLICTYSGGKDSDVMLELFKRSGIQFEVHHSHTTVDAPQTVYHIRDVFKKLELEGIKCEITMPSLTMWQLIVKKKIPPTRLARYCCAYLKENDCKNRMIATGVRWDESKNRANRGGYETLAKNKADRVVLSDDDITDAQTKKEFEQLTIPGTDSDTLMLMNDNSKKRRFIERCEMKAKTVCNPIIDWKDRDIKGFIESEKICMNPLYGMGFNRCGCIGCPMTGKRRYFEFEKFPAYERAYKRAFSKMLDAMKADGTGKKPKWKNGDEVFLWWMEDENIPGQMTIFDFMEG